MIRRCIRLSRGISLLLVFALTMMWAPAAQAADIGGDNTVTPAAPNVYHVGDTITYSLRVDNTNPNPIVVDIWDVLPSGEQVTLGTDIEIAPASSVHYALTYTVRAQDIIKKGSRFIVENVLRAEGEETNTFDPVSLTVKKSSVVIRPALAIATTVDFNGDASFGELEENYKGSTATWKVVVTNTGDADLAGITVTDTNGHAYGPGFSLKAGKSLEFTYPQVIESPTTLAATASGFDQLGGSVGPVSDDAKAVPFQPDVSIVKCVDFDKDGTFSAAEKGFVDQSATWRIVVTNSGDLALTDVVVTDSNGREFGPVSLAVGASETFTYDTQVTEDTVNSASVTALDPQRTAVGPKHASASVTVYQPGIVLEKTVSPSVVLSGEAVMYSYKVTNTGDVDFSDVTVTDDKLGLIGTTGSLAAGASTALEMPAVIEVDTVNVGNATGSYTVTDGSVREIADTDDAFVDVVRPAVEIVKTSDAAEEGVDPGDPVTYSFRVTNTGDVTLYDVVVVDDKLGQIGTVDELAPDAVTTLSKTTALTSDTYNIATVTAHDEWEHPVTDTDDEFVKVIPPAPDLMIAKAADVETAAPGGVITYTLTYTNIGNGVAQGYSIVDDFDERYVDIVDAAGGVVADGTITWLFEEALAPAQTKQLAYTVRVKSPDIMPTTLTAVDNNVVISTEGDTDLTNNTADERVLVDNPFLPFTPEDPEDPEDPSDPRDPDDPTDPFLPFTGGDGRLLSVAMIMALVIGITLRRSGQPE